MEQHPGGVEAEAPLGCLHSEDQSRLSVYGTFLLIHSAGTPDMTLMQHTAMKVHTLNM